MKDRHMFGKPLVLVATCIVFALGTTANAQQIGQLNPDTTSPTAFSLQGLSMSPQSLPERMAWSRFLSCVTRQNAQGMTASRFYLFYIPGGSDEQAVAARQRQESNLEDIISRGVLPGNLIAFGGPDAGATTQVVSRAFSEAPSKYPLTNVTVVVIDRKADESQLGNLIKPRGATFRLVDLTTATCSAAAASATAPAGNAIFPPPAPPLPPPPPPRA
jgi:hypothetical protein